MALQGEFKQMSLFFDSIPNQIILKLVMGAKDTHKNWNANHSSKSSCPCMFVYNTIITIMLSATI